MSEPTIEQIKQDGFVQVKSIEGTMCVTEEYRYMRTEFPVEALQAEKQNLEQRIDEIDSLLGV